MLALPVPRRALTLLVVSTLLVVALPVAPVSADEPPPEIKTAVLDDLQEVEGTEAGDEGAGIDPQVPPSAGGDVRAPGTGAEAGVAGGPDDDPTVSEVMEAEFPFTSVGLRGTGSPEVWLRHADADGTWSAWEFVEPVEEVDGPDVGTPEQAGEFRSAVDDAWSSDVIWVGEATHLQVRVADGDLDDIEVHTIDAMGLSETPWQRVSRRFRSLGTKPAEASSYPGLVTRAQWGANESWMTWPPRAVTVEFGVLHHTVNSNTYTPEQAPGIVRSIYHWHAIGQGWGDIGYNLLVDRFGTVYEGRAGGVHLGVVGAHARNWNAGSFGLAIIGDFDVASPPTAAVEAATDVIAWKYRVHDLDPDPMAKVEHNSQIVPTLVGHRDVGQTACPGAYLYPRMGELRDAIAAKVAPPATASSASPPTSTSPGFDTNGWTPVVGDWNGNGQTTIGWFRDGRWRLRYYNSGGPTHFDFVFGREGDRPVVGDWNGDGRNTVGVVRNRRWLLRNHNSDGRADHSFYYGVAGDWPLVGDWNGDGRDTVGIVRDREWHLRHSLSGGPGELTFTYGRTTRGDIPMIGDWNGDGRDTIGIVRDGEWHLRNSLSGGPGELTFVYGQVSRGDLPRTGDWDADGHTTVGVVRDGHWQLRNSHTAGPADASFTYR
jgi:hypothetical protein